MLSSDSVRYQYLEKKKRKKKKEKKKKKPELKDILE